VLEVVEHEQEVPLTEPVELPHLRRLGDRRRHQRRLIHGRQGTNTAPSRKSSTSSAGDDGTVRLWEGILWSDVGHLRAIVCSLVGRRLTEGGWEELVPGVEYRSSCP